MVGDDAQSIYSFRAASVENILNFPARFTPPAYIAKLEKNYRSVQPILDAANSLIGEETRQYQKRLYSDQPSQQKPRYVSVADDQAQADYVVDRVLATRESGVALKQQAVLMRNALSREVDSEVIERSVNAWEQMLSAASLGGRAGYEVLAKRPTFRGSRMKQDLKE